MTDTRARDNVSLDAGRYVEDIYRLLLAREPEAAAMRDKVGLLQRGIVTPGDLLSELLNSDEFARRAPEFLHVNGVDHRRGLFNDSTQFGELPLLLRTWLARTTSAPFVVDVGARGRARSNSYDLMRYFDWRGLLIEANPQLAPVIRREFAGLDFQIATCAVSNYRGRAEFVLGANDDVSSLEASSAEGWGSTRGVIDVSVRRLPDLLVEYGAPRDFGLLSIDVEGEDVRVLNDLADDGRFRPDWVLIEASDDFRMQSLEQLPTSEATRAMFEIAGATSANLLLRCVLPQRSAG